jgi:ABC-type branched-subunit amino acid transport system substrate-binding protein
MLWLGLGTTASACDLALGLNEYDVVDGSVEPAAEPDSGVIPQTFTIGMISASDDRVAQRQHGANLAVELINQVGGVPDGTGRKRTLTLAAATSTSVEDSLRMLQRRAKLSAVIGPDSSDDMRALLAAATGEAQLFTVGPNNSVDSLVETEDSDLSWSLVPTDSQRMPLMMRALGDLEAALTAARSGRALRLGVLYRDDAFGRGWRETLEGASWGGVGLTHADNAARVSIEAYDPRARDQAELVQRQLAFAPDVLVVIGMGEAVSQLLAPLEQAWSTDQRPEYLLTDATKGSELLSLVAERTDLISRVRGIGATPTALVRPSYQGFLGQYAERFPGAAAEPVGAFAAAAYDAVFVIAYALAAAAPGNSAGSGPELSGSVRRLTGGALQVATYEPQQEVAFSTLAQGAAIDARGTLSAFAWDSGGGIAGGAVEVWCVSDAAAPHYASTGLTFDIGTRSFGTEPSECNAGPAAQSGTAQPELSQPSARSAAPVATRPPVTTVPTPDAGLPDAAQPALPPYSLSVHYQANDIMPNDSSIRPFIRVVNPLAAEYVPLRELSVRYYIDNEHADRCPSGCVAEVSYAGTQPSGRAERAQARFVATNGTLGYLEVSFPGVGAADLAASETLEVQLHFHTDPYLPFDELNDYSFDRTARTFRETERITAYVSDVLVWGIEPAP